jgi:murein DD-endopeptidase MepM/ murein hydrolase activator NlpD
MGHFRMVKSFVGLLVLLAGAVAGVCAELPAGKDGGAPVAGNPPTGRKTGSKGKKIRKPDITNPETLAEIVEKAISASEAPGTEEGTGNLDLPVRGRITSSVGPRHDPINGELRMHNGVDIAIPEGTPVKPVATGRVAYSGLQAGYGNMVIVQHEDGMISIYAHHSRNLVKVGDRVSKETRLAYSGSTGHSTGPHLHFEAWQGGMNVTRAFLPTYDGQRIEESSHGSLEKTNLRKVVLVDGTILFVEVARQRN